jgi:hypothetical protein
MVEQKEIMNVLANAKTVHAGMLVIQVLFNRKCILIQ